LLERALGQIEREGQPPVAMLYFHPWEFDPGQQQLPLGRLSRFRTYVGVDGSRAKLERLLESRTFVRAVDVAQSLVGVELAEFPLAPAENWSVAGAGRLTFGPESNGEKSTVWQIRRLARELRDIRMKTSPP